MDSDVLFRSIKVGLNKKPITDCELAIECNSKNYRLYVDKDIDKSSFYCLAVEFASSRAASIDNIWECPELTVTPLFNITAYFDGVRHLEFNRESNDLAGYIYYPNIQGMLELLKKVREIELEICVDCDE